MLLERKEKWPVQMHWPNVDCLVSVILNHEVNHEKTLSVLLTFQAALYAPILF